MVAKSGLELFFLYSWQPHPLHRCSSKNFKKFWFQILKIHFHHEKLIFFARDFFPARYGCVLSKNDIYNARFWTRRHWTRVECKKVGIWQKAQHIVQKNTIARSSFRSGLRSDLLVTTASICHYRSIPFLFRAICFEFKVFGFGAFSRQNVDSITNCLTDP